MEKKTKEPIIIDEIFINIFNNFSKKKQEEIKKRMSEKLNKIIEFRISKILRRKFIRGEREWCIDCAKRIKKVWLKQNESQNK